MNTVKATRINDKFISIICPSCHRNIFFQLEYLKSKKVNCPFCSGFKLEDNRNFLIDIE